MNIKLWKVSIEIDAEVIIFLALVGIIAYCLHLAATTA